MVKYIVFGLVGFLLIVAAAGGTAYVVITAAGPKAPATTPREEQDDRGAALDEKAKQIDLGKFTTNLADKDRPRYIDVSFMVVVRDDKDAKLVETNKAVIRDGILTLLASLNSSDVAGKEGAEGLKTGVQAKLNELLGTRAIQRVLITNIVVQF